MANFDANEIVDYVIARVDQTYDNLREIISVTLESEESAKTFIRQATRSDFHIIDQYLDYYEEGLVTVELLKPNSHIINKSTLEQRMQAHLEKCKKELADKERKRIAQKEATLKRNAEAKRKAEEKAISDAKNLLKQKGLI